MQDREWGGYLPLELPQKNEYFSFVDEDDIVRLDCGRSTFWYALNDCKPSKLYVPYLNCINSTDPADSLGIPYEFYRLSDELLPVGINPNQNEAVLWVNYYGNSNSRKVKKLIESYDTNWIIDNCHAFFTEVFPKVYNCYSTRKFFGVCDGAYLIKENIKKIELPVSESAEEMTFSLKSIEKGTNACYKESLINENRLGNSPHLMSILTKRILSSIDYDNVQCVRTKNIMQLHKHLEKLNLFEIDLSSNTHICYPFLTNKFELRNKLLAKKIYIPTWWRHVPELLNNDESLIEVKLSNYMLILPIDQRYSTDDMDDLADIVLKEYSNC